MNVLVRTDGWGFESLSLFLFASNEVKLNGGGKEDKDNNAAMKTHDGARQFLSTSENGAE